MSSENATAAPFHVSQKSKVTLPLALLLSLLFAVATGAVILNSTREQVARNTGDIVELKRDQQTTREILIRIDENVKQLKEAKHP